MLENLRIAVANGGNLVNLGRSLAVHNHPLADWVVAATPWLEPSAKFTERVYCLINGITARPVCPLTDKPRRFINFFRGYATTSCRGPRTATASSGLTAEDMAFLHAHHADMAHVVNSLPRQHPELFLRLLAHTASFGNARPIERVYCVLNGIAKRPKKTFRDFAHGYVVGRGDAEVYENLRQHAALVGSTSIAQGKMVRVFLKRNREVNADLYALPAEAVGTAFVVCPVLGVRMLNLKRPYVEGVLGMSWRTFRERFPDVQLACAGHSARIAAGLTAEIAPGVTRHAAGVAKATASRARVGPDGLTGNARRGMKTRATHMQIGTDGMTGYKRLAHYRNTTILPNGLSVQQNGLRKRLETMVDGERSLTRASKVSARRLAPLLHAFSDAGLKYYFGATEYGVRTREGHFFYDLVVPDIAVCVEYQSAAYHPNPAWTEPRWRAWKPPFTTCRLVAADEKYAYDLVKARIMFRERGYRTWFVWQDSVKIDVERILTYFKAIRDVQKKRPL